MRHQLPSYSPLRLPDIFQASLQRVRAPGVVVDAAARLLRDRYSADAVVLCESGTQALETAIRLLARRLGRRPVVALPAFACFEVGAAAVGSGLDIVLYDLDPQTLAPDLDSLQRALQRGARIVVVASLYGLPVDWEAVTAVAARFGASVIEDAAQGHGAAWRGLPLGSLGDVSVLSFGRGKGWTGAGGGAVLLRSVPVGQQAGDLVPARGAASSEARTVLLALLQWLAGRPALFGLPRALPWLGLGETRYHPPAPIRAAAPWSLALLAQTLSSASAEAEVRRRRAAAWDRSLPFGPLLQAVTPEPRSSPGYLRYPLRLALGMAGFHSPSHALRRGAAPTYPAGLWQVPEVRGRMLRPDGRWAGAECLVRELVTLPTHSRTTDADRDQLLRLLPAPAERRDGFSDSMEHECVASPDC